MMDINNFKHDMKLNNELNKSQLTFENVSAMYKAFDHKVLSPEGSVRHYSDCEEESFRDKGPRKHCWKYKLNGEGLTVDGIAKKLNISVATFYRRISEVDTIEECSSDNPRWRKTDRRKNNGRPRKTVKNFLDSMIEDMINERTS